MSNLTDKIQTALNQAKAENISPRALVLQVIEEYDEESERIAIFQSNMLISGTKLLLDAELVTQDIVDQAQIQSLEKGDDASFMFSWTMKPTGEGKHISELSKAAHEILKALGGDNNAGLKIDHDNTVTEQKFSAAQEGFKLQLATRAVSRNPFSDEGDRLFCAIYIKATNAMWQTLHDKQ